MYDVRAYQRMTRVLQFQISRIIEIFLAGERTHRSSTLRKATVDFGITTMSRLLGHENFEVAGSEADVRLHPSRQ
jgi:hypothetical protein